MSYRTQKPEDAFMDQVIALAKLRGWKVAHFRGVCVRRPNGTVYWETPVQADGKGFPDLLMVREKDGKKLVAELKVGRNKASAEQEAWLAAFRAAGVPAFVWYPGDWQAIERTLDKGE